MYRGTIIERLTGAMHSHAFANEADALYHSVANNLSKIFSTNAGSASTVEDYGRPDLNNIHLSLKDSIEAIELASERCIAKYEPRLHEAEVSIVREHMQHNEMTLFIKGMLVVNGKINPIHYKANLMSNGSVKVVAHEN